MKKHIEICIASNILSFLKQEAISKEKTFLGRKAV